MALGCGSSSATPATPSTSTTAAEAVAVTTPLAWLVAEAKPTNKRLNQDQAEILVASRSAKEASAGTFFAHLASACTAMLRDARRARGLPKAPSATLSAAWYSMATATETYASDCLTLTRTHSNASLTTWNTSLKTMDTANAALNSVVSAIRSGASGSAG